jgi:hypothetical protein
MLLSGKHIQANVRSLSGLSNQVFTFIMADCLIFLLNTVAFVTLVVMFTYFLCCTVFVQFMCFSFQIQQLFIEMKRQ